MVVVGVSGGGTGVLVARGALGAVPELSGETVRTCGFSQVANMTASASYSGSVTVRCQVFLMDTQSMAYWHQYDWSLGFHVSGALAPFERFALAVTAMRCCGSSR